MRYPVKLIPDGRGFLATFPDIPEAITQGDTFEEALANAQDALETALEFYFEENRPIPPPGAIKRGYRSVELPLVVSAKVLLLNEMLYQKVYAAELAKRMGITRSEMSRLMDLRYNSKIDAVATALKALGKTIELTTIAA